MNELPISPDLQSLRELSEMNRVRRDPYLRQQQKEDSFERRAQQRLASLDKQMDREVSFEKRAQQRLDSLNRKSIPITYRDDELFNTPILDDIEDDIEDDKLFKTPRSLSKKSPNQKSRSLSKKSPNKKSRSLSKKSPNKKSRSLSKKSSHRTPRSLSRQSSIDDELFESPRSVTLSDKYGEYYDWENPIEIKVRLNEKLCKILPQGCFGIYNYNVIFEYKCHSKIEFLEIISIEDDNGKSIYDNWKVWTFLKSIGMDYDGLIKHINGIFRLPDQIRDINFDNRPGAPLGTDSLVILQLNNSRTIIMDFNKYTDTSDILPSVLYPDTTIYKCPRNSLIPYILNGQTQCNGNDKCFDKNTCIYQKSTKKSGGSKKKTKKKKKKK